MRFVDIIFAIGKIFSAYGKTYSLRRKTMTILYSGYMSSRFRKFGISSRIAPKMKNLVGAKYISVGKNCYLGQGMTLTAVSSWEGAMHTPEIEIGDHVQIGEDSHIVAINKIVIKDGVLTGKNLLITDNAHGIEGEDAVLAPLKRPVFSPGPVVIEEDVWIGEKVSILPNVTIGRGCVIGAHSMVNKSIPPYSLVAGCPARVIRQLVRVE